MKWSAGLTCVALLMGAACNAEAPRGEVPTYVVPEATDFQYEVQAEGVLEAVEATPVLAPAESEVPMKIAWLAEDGARVSQGDVIVRFDDSEALRQRADSHDDARSAQHKIDKVRHASEITRHKRQSTADLAAFETRVAEEFVADDDFIFSRNEIVESTIDRDLAHAKATHSRRLQTIEKKVATHELKLERIGERRASHELERAEGVLGMLEITAPHDGVLVLRRNWQGDPVRVGDTVWRGQKVAELPHAAELEAELFVLEADAGRVVEGLPAKVRVEAHPRPEHDASVQRVDTLAKPRHPEVPVHYVGVTLALSATDTTVMRIGQRVTAGIEVHETNALVVPRQAVFERDGKSVVFRKQPSGGGFEAAEVELGVATAGRVVIASGVEAGDEIAVRDPDVERAQWGGEAADESKKGGAG